MSKPKIIELDATNTCDLCSDALAKYSCPKCGVKYCSLVCYRSENHLQCSEEFYKNFVVEELALQDDEATKKKMLEILERNRINEEEEDSELDSDDEDEIANISERLAGVDLDNADKVWEKLTQDERQEFVAFLKSEDVTKLIPPWKPWWSYTSKGVQELSSSEDYKTRCPKIVTIRNFSEISKTEPADCVGHNLINVIAAYAFATRYFNGEHHDFCHEVVSCVVAICLCLKVNQNFQDFDSAVKSVEFQCVESDWIVADVENFKMLRDDVVRILQGPESTNKKFYILCALSDLHKLLNGGLKTKRQRSKFGESFPNDHFPDVKLQSKNKIRGCLRKVDYLLSFVKDVFIF